MINTILTQNLIQYLHRLKQRKESLMKRIRLERTFQATQELLWELIVDPVHYRYWTEAFSVGSDFIGDWSKDSLMHFVSEEQGLLNGMIAKIEERNYPESISIHHIGLLIDGVSDYDSPYAKEWTPSYENYRLIKLDATQCLFQLEQDLPEEHASSMLQAWELAFDKIATYLVSSDTIGKVITLREMSIHTPSYLWHKLTTPDRIMTWNFASPDWHCPNATIDLQIGGEFHYEMAAKDGSVSFDFWGTFVEIIPNKKLSFVLGDGRAVTIEFSESIHGTLLKEYFEPEQENNLDLQRSGWLAILRNLAQD